MTGSLTCDKSKPFIAYSKIKKYNMDGRLSQRVAEVPDGT